MDTITRELDKRITYYQLKDRSTDVACYQKIKLDYFLMLTIAAAWDLKHSSMDENNINMATQCLSRPEVGKLIRLIDAGLNLDKSIVDIFNLYKKWRNLSYGHNTFDEFEAKKFNSDCEECWNALMLLQSLSDADSELIRKIYQEDNDFYYIDEVKPNGEMIVELFGNKEKYVQFSKIEMKSWMSNKDNDIQAGDLFLCVDNHYIKVSPFIQYAAKKEMFMMLLDIETSPLCFKMAYVYRTEYASDSATYLEKFPEELKAYFSEKGGKNGLFLNKFSQYELFQQEYYQGIHQGVQQKLDDFITGNMAYGAVRGVGGVGKTSAVFMWMNRVLNNEEGILDVIRDKFDLRRIVFLSAKTKVYSRDVNENLTNFYDIESDVSNFEDVINCVYSICHTTEKEGTTFEDKVKYVKDYSNKSPRMLIIIDDYESLPKESRDKIQQLKDKLDPNAVKMLITTRFASKESKDIIVERLEEKDCANMTDHIFKSKEWRSDITPKEMHELTGGLPLLIWYAKAYYKKGQLSSKRLKGSFSGPTEGLERYLFDNFTECFEEVFTKNFLMMATRYYELHRLLQISKITAIFLCLEEPKEYKAEDEEFYFRELTDLKLISINQNSNSIDFSPLMVYMDKASKKQEPKEQYQDDNLRILAQLDEEKYKELYAVVESTEYLTDETKCRVLSRLVDFSQTEESVRILAIRKIFALSSKKLQFYEEHTQIFQNNQELIKALINYLLDDPSVIKEHYKLVRDFIHSIYVSMENQDLTEMVASDVLALISELLSQSLDERSSENITNPELEKRAQSLRELASKFSDRMEDPEEKENLVSEINEKLSDIGIYCEIDQI